MIADRGQAVALAGDRPAPICRILDQTRGIRRGIELDVARTASGSLILARGNQLDGNYNCAEANQVQSSSDTTLRDCRAEQGGELLCVMSLERTLQAVEAHYDQLSPSVRGTVILKTHISGNMTEYAEELAEVVAGFVYTEHVWIVTDSKDLLETSRDALGSRNIFNVRFGLLAGTGASDADTAWDIEADVVLVPARSYTILEDDASQTSIDEGGTAWGVYRADSPADVEDLMRYEGIRLAIGALAPVLESRWGIEPPEPLDCEAFLTDNDLRGLFFETNGSCPEL